MTEPVAPPRIVLIGCGDIARAAHLPALASLRDQGVLDLAGVCDLDSARAQEAASKFGVSSWGTDWQRLATETKADAVAVVTLPGPNAEISIAALEMGLHVLCEKPPGRDEAQARRMADAARRRPDRVTMVAFNRRHAPLYRTALERSRRLGPVHSFAARFTRGAMGQAPSNSARDWVTSDGSHALDLAVATVGFPEHVSVARRGVGAGPDNAWIIQLSGAQGQASVWLDFAAGRRMERFEWAGPGYDVALELPERGDFAGREGKQAWTAAEVSGSTEFFVNYGFLDEHRAFADAVAGRTARPEADFEYGARFMGLVGRILAMPSVDGAAAAAERPETASAAAPAPEPAGEIAAGSGGRPVVSVLQTPEAARKYFPPAALAELSATCNVRFVSESDAPSALRSSDAILLGWGAPALSPAAFAAADRLRIAIVLGASVKWALPADALAPDRLVLCNTADAIGRSVAEHCLLLTLAGLRRLTDVDRQMHGGGWPPGGGRKASLRKAATRAAQLPMLRPLKPYLKPAAQRILAAGSSNGGSGWSDLRGQTVGLIGWGHVARRFAELLAPFECHLLVASEHASGEELRRLHARRASVGEVFAGAKVLSLHKGLNERTRGFIGGPLLATLPRGTVFVNTARAGLVDEEALIARARRGDVVFALDVFHQEPLARRHALRSLSNVILSPHNASSTPECAQRVGEQALDILRDWAAGRPVPALTTRQLAEMT